MKMRDKHTIMMVYVVLSLVAIGVLGYYTYKYTKCREGYTLGYSARKGVSIPSFAKFNREFQTTASENARYS